MELRTPSSRISPSEISTTQPTYPFFNHSILSSSSSSSSSSSLTSITDNHHLHRGSGQFMLNVHRSSIGEEIENEDDNTNNNNVNKNIFMNGNMLNLLDCQQPQNGYLSQSHKGSWDEQQQKSHNQNNFSLHQQLEFHQQFQQLRIQQMQQQIDQQILTIQQQQQQINEQKQLLQQQGGKQNETEQTKQPIQLHHRRHRTQSNSSSNSPDIVITTTSPASTVANEQVHNVPHLRQLHNKHLLHPLLENRENLLAVDFNSPSKKHTAKLMRNTVNEDLDNSYKYGPLTRCYSMGSSELNSLFKRQQGKRRETIQVAEEANNNKNIWLLLNGERKGSLNEGRPLGENRQYTTKRQYLADIASPLTFCAPSNSAIDLTCKRKRSFDNRLLMNNNSDSNDDEEYNYNSRRSSNRESFSILKSVLMSNGPVLLPPPQTVDSDDDVTNEISSRLRSHTLSVCGLQGLRRSSAGNETTSTAISSTDSRKVTLAKKNLAPVQRFVTDRLKEIARFASRQPDFNQLLLSDRRALLCRSGPRLLLLYMAELNFKFAITPVWESSSSLTSALNHESIDALGLKMKKNSKSDVADREVPTQRFVETIQSFVSKCQSQSITADEYFYMRLIVLFHIGSEPLMESHHVARQHKEAQQDLQDLSIHKFPNDRLRYSKLLLTLYTLFGINCSLVESLFYSPSDDSRSISEYLCDELDTIVASNGNNNGNQAVSMEINNHGNRNNRSVPIGSSYINCDRTPDEYSKSN